VGAPLAQRGDLARAQGARVSDLEAFFLDWGYVVVFAAPLLENAGLPVPGDSALFWLAYLSAQGGLRLDLLIGLAMVGAVLGDNLGYWAGRRGGRPLIERLGRRWPVAAHALGRTERFFARHGALTIFVGRFVPGLRVFAALVAGAALMGWGRFFRANCAGAVAWATATGLAGWALGHQVSWVRTLTDNAWLAGLTAAMVAAGLLYLQYRLARRLDV
jgi:membrane protein DedA with SNARE-associated domain